MRYVFSSETFVSSLAKYREEECAATNKKEFIMQMNFETLLQHFKLMSGIASGEYPFGFSCQIYCAT